MALSLSSLLFADGPPPFDELQESAELITSRKKLEKAEEELAESQARVLEARIAYYGLELDVIASRLDGLDAWLAGQDPSSPEYRAFLTKELPTLFAKERALLAEMIDAQVELSTQAQELLNRLLARITALNNELRVLQSAPRRTSWAPWR